VRARPLLLDAACKAGGAGMGYHRAGFDVIGIDIEPQPRYPFEFIQGDAVAFVREMGWMFDAFHGSPPCHDHTVLRSRSGLDGTGRLLAEFRSAFEATGRPCTSGAN
jgi:DNA (cytosine-5)-methyltransferase 1